MSRTKASPPAKSPLTDLPAFPPIQCQDFGTTPIEPNSELDYLIRDLAVMTSENLYTAYEVYSAYGLTEQHYQRLKQNPHYTTRFDFHRMGMGTGMVGILRAQTQLMLAGSIRRVHGIVVDPASKPADILKATQFLAELADVKPKPEAVAGGSGLVVNIDFGQHMGRTLAQSLDIIEHDPQGGAS